MEDWWIILNMILLGLTNGIGSTHAMVYGGRGFPDKDQDTVGKMMSLYLLGGIFFGTFLAQSVVSNFV